MTLYESDANMTMCIILKNKPVKTADIHLYLAGIWIEGHMPIVIKILIERVNSNEFSHL